jgi:hypothetical protein
MNATHATRALHAAVCVALPRYLSRPISTHATEKPTSQTTSRNSSQKRCAPRSGRCASSRHARAERWHRVSMPLSVAPA